MNDFIELSGASGAAYRFRLWAHGAGHPPMGGNYAFVRIDSSGLVVVAAAAADDLSMVRAALEPAALERGATHLFTRLNMSRVVRTFEADDIVAFYALEAEPSQRKRGA